MKKMLITLLVLAMVAPVLADVAVTATDEGSGHLKIKIAPTGGAVVRGVALKLTNANGAIIDATTDVTATQFNTFIDYAYSNAGYVIGTGHAIANPSAAGVATLPASNFSLCAGYLDQAGAQAGVAVDSFFDVFFTLSGNATIGIALDTLRGGIVGDTLGTVTVQASQVLIGVLPETLTGTLVFVKTTAAPAISGRVNGGRVESFQAAGVTSSQGGPIEYQFTWGDGVVGAWGAATQTYTYTYTAAATYNVSVKARPASNPAAEVASAAVALTTEEVKSSATFYATWAQFGRPTCWAYPRNCKGDVDGLKQGNAATGFIWVSTNDLTPFLAAYGVKEPTKGPGVASIPNGICADFDHAQQGNAATGFIRVSTNDLTPFLASYGVKEPTKGPGIGICAQTNYHYWTGAL